MCLNDHSVQQKMVIQTVFLLLMLAALINSEQGLGNGTVMSHSKKNKKFTELKQCTLDSCGGFSYKDIPKYYNGLFLTKKEIDERTKGWAYIHREKYGPPKNYFQWFNRPRPVIHKSSYHDYDRCCPTRLFHVQATEMTNINGEQKVIINLSALDPPKYQFIPQAECVPEDGSCERSRGTCVMEYIVIYLLVADFSVYPPFIFDRFRVPGYCSCKN